MDDKFQLCRKQGVRKRNITINWKKKIICSGSEVTKWHQSRPGWKQVRKACLEYDLFQTIL